MIYLEPPGTDPYFNLALEEYVFEQMDRSRAYFMLWQNSNTIVVGKYQNTAEEINQAFVDAHGIRVVRRLSGGGAVYHDTGNLNFTFIVDQDTAPGLNFKIFVRPVVEALARFGVHAEFTGRNDLTIGGMKFSGNSQYAKHGRLLHHGCIMLDSNLTDVADALRVKQAKFDSKAVKSVRSRVTTINTHAPPHRYGGLQVGAAGVRHGRWSTGALYSDRRGYAGRTEAAGREVCHMGVELRLLTPL